MTQETGKRRRQYDLEERLIDFVVRVSDVVEKLPATRLGSYIAGQLVRWGTAGAAIYGEAQGAESRNDFIHKMKVALKELRETRIWLKLIERKTLFGLPEKLAGILDESNELVAIFVASIATARKNRNG